MDTERNLHGRTTETLKRLRDLDRRLGRLADSVAGQCPEQGNEVQAKSIDEHLHEKFDNVARFLSDCETSVVRLENSIGSHQSAPQMKTAVAGGGTSSY